MCINYVIYHNDIASNKCFNARTRMVEVGVVHKPKASAFNSLTCSCVGGMLWLNATRVTSFTYFSMCNIEKWGRGYRQPFTHFSLKRVGNEINDKPTNTGTF